MTLPAIDEKYFQEFLVELLNSPSPTGFSHHAVSLTSDHLKKFPALELSATRKGGLVAF